MWPTTTGFGNSNIADGAWFQKVIERPASAQPAYMPLRANIDVLNLLNANKARVTTMIFGKVCAVQLSAGEKLFYHGTDAESAKSIINYGIDLTRSTGRHDFSNGSGFYLTTDYTKAVEWAGRKARQTAGHIGTVIAFKISQHLQTEQVHISLNVQTLAGQEQWKKFLLYFRNGVYDDSVISLLQNAKFIEGPVSKNSNFDPYNFNQTCIRDPEYARRYGCLQNICFTVFFDTTGSLDWEPRKRRFGPFYNRLAWGGINDLFDF